MMVNVVVVVLFLAWGFLCFVIGLAVAAFLYDEELMCKWLKRS